MNKPTRSPQIDFEKIIAEKLNGRFAVLGLIALIGAYSTTGQVIPGYL
tara:strand:+ start:21100 stop:21243 length:144 start_codon:yes stop_codon:yes gene_type:complete